MMGASRNTRYIPDQAGDNAAHVLAQLFVQRDAAEM